jgi:hypothetical protein
MRIEISVRRIHLACFIIALAVLAGINYVIAQTSYTTLGHSASQIGPGTFDGSSSDTWSFPGSVDIGGTRLVVDGGAVIGQTDNAGYKGVTNDGNDLIVNGQFAAGGSGGAAMYKLGVGCGPPSGEGNLDVSNDLSVGGSITLGGTPRSGWPTVTWDPNDCQSPNPSAIPGGESYNSKWTECNAGYVMVGVYTTWAAYDRSRLDAIKCCKLVLSWP